MGSVGVMIDVDIFDTEKAASINDEFGAASKLFGVALVESNWHAVVAFFRNENFDFDIASATIGIV